MSYDEDDRKSFFRDLERQRENAEADQKDAKEKRERDFADAMESIEKGDVATGAAKLGYSDFEINSVKLPDRPLGEPLPTRSSTASRISDIARDSSLSDTDKLESLRIVLRDDK